MYWVFKSLLRRQQKLQNRQFMIMVVTRFINIEVFLFFTDCFAYSDMKRCCFFNSKITCCGCFPYSKSIICSAINASPFKSAGKRRENQTERLKRSKRDSWQKICSTNIVVCYKWNLIFQWLLSYGGLRMSISWVRVFEMVSKGVRLSYTQQVLEASKKKKRKNLYTTAINIWLKQINFFPL